ncbi:hypothetical protein AB4Z54_36320 [Streptomyces sp. MCAF7]
MGVDEIKSQGFSLKELFRGLVDGQQRFVTLHLLFLQLRARVRDHGDARRVDS